MRKLGTYLQDMAECIDARLLCASALYGAFVLGLLFFGTVPVESLSEQLAFTLLPLASLVGLGLCRVAFKKRGYLRQRWLWFFSIALAASAFALFVGRGQQTALTAMALAWLCTPFCLVALMQRYAVLPLRRRIAMSATSILCAVAGLLALSAFGAPTAFAAMVALPLVAAAYLPGSAELPGGADIPQAETATPVRYAPSFLFTIMAYAALWVMAGNAARDASYVGGSPVFAAVFSLAGIIILSLHKGLKGFVEDSNSAYKPAPLLMAIGLALLAWLPAPLVSAGAALVATGFCVFFVYFWIVVGNHIQKFSWNGVGASTAALAPLVSGLLVGRLAAGFVTGISQQPLQTTATAGLLVLVVVLWVVAKGDLFANEPDQNASVFKLEPPKPAASTDGSDAAIEAFTRRFGISKREQDVVHLLSKGRNVPFICDELFIAKSTVQTHIKHIYAKPGATSRQELLDIIEQAARGD